MAPINQQKALTIFSIVDDQFQIDTDAFNSVLDKVGDLPFVLLSINGACREGKSYVLNYFIRFFRSQGSPDWFHAVLSQQEMFSWRSGRKRETLGINLWSEPFIVTREGRRVAILLCDCQGLFDDKTTFQENAVIFSLSNLLSSVMIYNAKAQIQENLLQNIQCFSDYARAIAVGENCGDQLPNLLFLVRDFNFLSEFELGFHSKDTFPKEILTEPQNYWSAIFDVTEDMPRENQIVRSEIMRKFRQISMFLLPHPGTKFVQNSDKFPPEPEFTSTLQSFIPLMASGLILSTKKVAGREVTGTEFKPFVNLWANVCRESATKFPPARAIGESTMIMQNEAAASTALASINQRFTVFLYSQNVGVSDDAMAQMYQKFLKEALDIYRRMRSLGGPEIEKKYATEIEEKSKQMFETTYSKINAEVRRRKQIELEAERERTENSKQIAHLSDEMMTSKKIHERQLEDLQKNQTKKDEEHARQMAAVDNQMEELKRQNKNFEHLEKQMEQLMQANLRSQEENDHQARMLMSTIRDLESRPPPQPIQQQPDPLSAMFGALAMGVGTYLAVKSGPLAPILGGMMSYGVQQQPNLPYDGQMPNFTGQQYPPGPSPAGPTLTSPRHTAPRPGPRPAGPNVTSPRHTAPRPGPSGPPATQ